MTDFIHVDKWSYKQDDALIQYNGKIMIVRFDRCFNVSDELNRFFVIKDIFVKKLDLITKYINYFIEFYDEDNEFITSYYKLKFLIDNKKRVKKLGQKGFIQAVYDLLLTPTMVEKIKRMVEDNYTISLSSTDDTKKYDKSLEFNDDHGKILLMISTAIKMMIPLMAHFANSRKIKKPDYFKFFEGLFILFGEEINIYNKLYLTIQKRVMRDYNGNKPVWFQKEMINGSDPSEFIDIMLKDRIIVDALFKYKFDESVHSFNISVINNQLKFFRQDKFDVTPKMIGYEKDAEGLSSVDKLVMNMNKIDESLIILSEINIKNTIKKIKKRFNITVEPEEIKFYMQNHKINKFLKRFVDDYYAKFFEGYDDLLTLTKMQYIELLIILKKKLIYDGNVFLPQILTGNIQGRLNSRVIQNNKFISRLESSSIYEELINDKFAAVNELKGENIIVNLLSNIINTKFTFVDYDMQDKLGDLIEINQNSLTDEFLKFLSEI